VVRLVVFWPVSKATTEKGVNFFEEKFPPPRKNYGYAYEFAHLWKKNPAGAHGRILNNSSLTHSRTMNCWALHPLLCCTLRHWTTRIPTEGWWRHVLS